MAKVVLLFFVYIFLPLAGAEDVKNDFKDPAIVQMCIKDFYIQCAEGMGVFISPNQILTAYHVVSPIFRTDNRVKGVLFFRHPKQPHIAIEFNRVITASAINDVAILEVTDYTSEDFYPLVEREEDNTFLIGETVSLKHFPSSVTFPFISIPVVVTGFDQHGLDYYMTAKLPYEYDLRGMSGGPVLRNNRLIGIVSRGSVSHTYIALVNREKVNRFEHCRSDDSCISHSMQALHEEAANENSLAQYLLFMKYRSGVEVEQDIAEAFNWLHRARLQGYTEE